MKTKIIGAFTLIEVIVAMCIVVLVSVSFLSIVKFSTDSHHISVQRYDLMIEAENDLENIINDMKSYTGRELTPDTISGIVDFYERDQDDYYISITQTAHHDLYLGEIIFKESRYERLCTQIHIP